MLLMYKRKGLVVQRVANKEGMYRIGLADSVFGANMRALENSILPIKGVLNAPKLYGIVLRGLKTPQRGGFYIVEFSAQKTVRIIAYADPYGRVFSSSEICTAPPARYPSLSFEGDKTPFATKREKRGMVYVHDGSSQRAVARYRCVGKHYTLFDSWYNFESYAHNLTYEEALARTFLAFVHRPALGASPVPDCGVAHILTALSNEHVLTGLCSLVSTIQNFEKDASYRPPALVRCLAHWLHQAGLDDLKECASSDDSLRLAYTTHYAKMFYLSTTSENSPIPLRCVWALEAALNRFLLVKEALGDTVSQADRFDCVREDARIIKTIALQKLHFVKPDDIASAGTPNGEWYVRCALASVIENLRLPIRVDISFQVNVDEGVAAFDVIVPDASFMCAENDKSKTSQNHAKKGAIACTPSKEQDDRARRYAMHIGLILATAAFKISPALSRVNFVAHPLPEIETKSTQIDSGTNTVYAKSLPAYVQVTLTREAYRASSCFLQARIADPQPLYESCGARFDVVAANALTSVDSLASSAIRYGLPEIHGCFLSDREKQILGVPSVREMRIDYDAIYRHLAEQLADRVAHSENIQSAISIVRGAQNEALSIANTRAVSSCYRLMLALAEGKIDTEDQNALIRCYLGEDHCMEALARAEKVAENNVDEAANILVDAVTEALVLNGFVDGQTTVYRAFDSYVSRIIYNRARYTKKGFPKSAAFDAEKTVELVPDAFFLCHLEIARLLEHSFGRSDEALYYGRRAIEIAPSTVAGYRQLGREYMLVGDMENAAAILQKALYICAQPVDVSMVYYQLGYVLWKSGHAREGATCYLKSVTLSSIAALQVASELKKLVDETGIEIPAREHLDEELRRANIPVAPTADVMAVLCEGAPAATDAGLFPVARNLLGVQLHYRPDDALADVLRSLSD